MSIDKFLEWFGKTFPDKSKEKSDLKMMSRDTEALPASVEHSDQIRNPRVSKLLHWFL